MAQFKKRELTTDEPLGGQLKSVRRTARLSLEQVAAGTKINKKYIKALEEGKYDELPAEVYARGFLENYAKFLGFPVDEVLLQYKRERGITGRVKATLALPTDKLSRPQLNITPRTLWAAAGFVVLFIVVSYLVTQISGFAAPPKLEVTKPVANATVNEESVDVEGRTDSGAQLAINDQPVPTDSDGYFREKVRLPSGTSSLRVTARNKTGRLHTITRSIIVQIPGQVAGTPTPAPVSGALFIVRIGPNSAYVTINVDGQNQFQGLLAPNTTQTFNSQSRVLLTTSNAGSTRVFFNGSDRGPAGEEGQFRRGVEYLVPTPPPSPTPPTP